jgi:SAM-dependent methyltransferase
MDRALSQLQERWFDLRYGTDTTTVSGLESLTIDGPNVADAVRYEPMRLRSFRRLLDALRPPTSGVFIDIGCGKGRQLLLAAEYGFKRLRGVEFAKELCCIARDNAIRHRRRTGIDSQIDVVHADATQYQIRDDENVFLVNNPFGAGLMEKLVQNISASLCARDRQVFIMYINPRFRSIMQGHGFMPVLELEGGDIITFSNKPRLEAVRNHESENLT